MTKGSYQDGPRGCLLRYTGQLICMQFAWILRTNTYTGDLPVLECILTDFERS